MSNSLLSLLTPRACQGTRLLCAAAVWSGVAFFLFLKGIYVYQDNTTSTFLIVVASGTIAGLIKSKFVLDNIAKKNILRIRSKPTFACLGGLFSFRNWGLILIMAVFGKLIGALPVITGLKTGIYVMVGSGLGYSSRLLWRAWRNSPAGGLQNS